VRIDWFTLAAQVLNFVILVFLLKRFLYRPVLDTIARREEGIRSRLEEARLREEAAAAESARLRREWEQLDATRADLLREAEREADERRRELAEEVRGHARKVREDWRAALLQQRTAFLQDLRRRVGQETFRLAARVVRDLGDAELEDRVIRVFLARLQGLPAEERAKFVDALERSGGRIGIKSAFPLGPERREELEGAVRSWTGSIAPHFHFEQDPELALGIEMRAGDRILGWSLRSYLEELEADVVRHLATEER
jgi:F-type H+-transporting ATPase subunit b